jgi:hypothetical protein
LKFSDLLPPVELEVNQVVEACDFGEAVLGVEFERATCQVRSAGYLEDNVRSFWKQVGRRREGWDFGSGEDVAITVAKHEVCFRSGD